MPSERIQRRIDQLLDRVEAAMDARTWAEARALCEEVLTLDAGNADAPPLLAVAARALQDGGGEATAPAMPLAVPPRPLPESFVHGRYRVLGLLGEGGKKVVYQAHDTVLDRDVAFALVKTADLDAAGRERVKREAQALGRLGAHPNIVTVHDLGEEAGQPYIVTELLPGGDVARLIADAPDHRLPLARLLEIATAIARALAFAHAKGVIHRDLKPGNVWLAQDGTPKLGDFGLAIADSDPRLTHAGMIAGTALYMAPEQATGGAVTARSDLYSLGCLLYELVTGRPPFIGDESVAIIGQHLHANPVAPSWHRPDCPPALEVLQLRLLEKDPAKRPAAAADVAEALAGISPTAKRTTSESRRQVQASGPSPVYQRAFVGREQELRQLEAAFDAAVSGQGGLVLVVGEPGIGKTTLTEQLATYAGLRGGRVLVGHCYEEGSLSLPYLPFVEAMRTYVLDREPAQLQRELGNAAPEVARIVSEVRDRVQVEPSVSVGDGAEDRYRLLQGVNSFLRNAGAVQPLVLVLEDLHDADRGTLDLLQFLARQLQGARLLVVGTYRDIEVDRQHPLSSTLAELRRGASFSRVVLRGLTADEVQRMINAIAGQDIPWQLAETVHRQTEGNPLFVQEVVRYLTESGLVERQDGRWQAGATESLLSSIPEGLRDVIGRRLSRLSSDCNRILAVAAVIGRDFTFETLRLVTGQEDEPLAAALEEAVRVAVLQDRSRGGLLQYRFAHAFFRQTLYEEIFAARRIRLHQQVARALEQQHAGRLEEHAAELAEHFAYSSDEGDLRKAIGYGRLAAERAQRVYAWGEAVGQLERCLQLQELVDPGDRAAVCELLLALAEALIAAGEMLRAANEVAERAFTLAEAAGDATRVSRAAALGYRAYMEYATTRAVTLPGSERWEERLLRVAVPESSERILAHQVAAARQAVPAGRLGEAHAQLEAALALARRRGDVGDLYTAATWNVTIATRPEDEVWRHALASEFAGLSRVGARPFDLSMLLSSSLHTFLSWGERAAAEGAYRELVAVSERIGQPGLQLRPLATAAHLARVDGQLQRSLDLMDEVSTLGDRLGLSELALASTFASFWTLFYLGRADDLLSRLAADQQYFAPVALASAGRTDEAREALRTFLAPSADNPERELTIPHAVALLAAAVLLGERETAAMIARYLAPLAEQAASYSVGPCPARLLGGAARINSDRAAAEQYYRQALTAMATINFRPEAALTRLELAELLAEDGSPEQRDEAERLLAAAIPELEAMGMAPGLERARRLEAMLREAPRPPIMGELATEQVLAAGSGAHGSAPVRSESEPSHADPAQTSTHASSGSAPRIGGQGAEKPAEQSAPIPSSPAASSPTRDLPLATRLVPGQVFISYSSDDHSIAFALDARLQAEAIPVWLDKRSIPPGSNWDAEIVEGIKRSAMVAVCVSPRAVASDHVRQELRLAMQYRKPVLPLLLQPTSYPGEVEYVLAGRQWVEVLDHAEAAWFPQVLAAVRRLA